MYRWMRHDHEQSERGLCGTGSAAHPHAPQNLAPGARICVMIIKFHITVYSYIWKIALRRLCN